MSPHVSVIIPMHDVEPYIAECLESLQAQDYGDFEAICVDNRSEDGTLAAARDAVGDDARFIFLEQESSGQSAARNAALEVARGTYLLNLDADDFYRPDTIGRLVGRADAERLDLLYFSAKTFYETRDLRRSNPERQDGRPDIPGIMSGQDLYVEFERTGAFRPSACLFLMRRDMIEGARLRFEEGIIHEDLLFTVMAAPLARRAAFLNETFYQRRMRPGSTMTSGRGVRNIRGHLVASMRMEAWLSGNRDAMSADFCDALCHRIHETWELVAADTRRLGEAEAEAFRDGLSREERIAFDLHGIELAAALGKVLDSTTFKAGRFLLAVPAALKDRLANRA